MSVCVKARLKTLVELLPFCPEIRLWDPLWIREKVGSAKQAAETLTPQDYRPAFQ